MIPIGRSRALEGLPHHFFRCTLSGRRLGGFTMLFTQDGLRVLRCVYVAPLPSVTATSGVRRKSGH